MPETRTANSTGILVVAVAWFLLAIVLGALGFPGLFPPPFLQVVLFGLVLILFLLFWRHKPFRRWVLLVDIRALLLIHLSRFVGIYFLVLHSRGELPYAFAVPGGWGASRSL